MQWRAMKGAKKTRRELCDNGGMRSAIADAIAGCDKRAALIAFITAGFPRADSTAPMLRAMAEAGADVLELGVPFSDPMADGAAIQRASERALSNGMTLRQCLRDVAAFRADNKKTPLALMGYANSFLNYPGGIAALAEGAAKAGANGMIAVDLSDRERANWRKLLNAAGVDMINLVAPTTAAKRMQKLAAESQGFVYAISLKGVTGAAHINIAEMALQMKAIKKNASVPTATGFGVRTPEHARAAAEFADGVVVGSRLVEAIEAADLDDNDSSVRAAAAAVAEFSAALADS